MTIYGTHLVINEDVFVSSLSRFLLLSWQKMKGFPLSYFLDRETEVVLQCVLTSLEWGLEFWQAGKPELNPIIRPNHIKLNSPSKTSLATLYMYQEAW